MPPKRMDVVYISDSDNEMLDASLQASSYDISSDDFQSPTKKPRISEAADHKQDIKSINIPNKAESDNGDDNGDGNDDSDDDDDHGEGDDDDSDDDDEDMFETVPTTASIEETEKGEDSVDNDALSDDSMPELGTVELTVGDTATDVLAPKRRRPIVTKSAREIRRQQHKIELVCKLVSSLVMNHICCDVETHARCISLLPAFAIDRVYDHMQVGKPEIRREWAASDLNYCLSCYKALIARKPTKRSKRLQREAGLKGRSIRQEFYQFLESANAATKPWHRPMMLAAMLRALTFDTRLCVGISPLPLKLTVQESVELDNKSGFDVEMLLPAVSNNSDSPGASKTRTSKGRSPTKKKLADPDVPEYWCEVYDHVSGRWMPINPYSGTIEKAQAMVKPNKHGFCKFAYILAMDSSGHVRDITKRYSQEFVNKTMKLRLESVGESVDKSARYWWPQWLKRWENPEQNDMDEKEDEEMKTRVMRSTMPKRISDFASNPYYVLARNLNQNEVLYPDGPVVGKVRGESVYLRENVKTVRTAMAWVREGRIVKDGEKPAKVVKQRAVTAKAKMEVEAREAAGKDAVSALFGEWQTELYKPPPVVDGKVPRNDYGRLDLFTPTMLPEGGAHVRDPGARRLCQTLGIDAVDAVIGFEFRRGVSTPIIAGVVIPRESLELLEDALQEDSNAAAEKQIAQVGKRAIKNWRKLLVSLQVRAEVDASFAARSARQEGITFKAGSAKGKGPEEWSSSPPAAQDTGGGFLL